MHNKINVRAQCIDVCGLFNIFVCCYKILVHKGLVNKRN